MNRSARRLIRRRLSSDLEEGNRENRATHETTKRTLRALEKRRGGVDGEGRPLLAQGGDFVEQKQVDWKLKGEPGRRRVIERCI